VIADRAHGEQRELFELSEAITLHGGPRDRAYIAFVEIIREHAEIRS
jgi:hypothetical protein